MTDDWVWDRVKYWWSLLNQKHNRHFDHPVVYVTDRKAAKAGYCRYTDNPEITLYEHYIQQQGEAYDQVIGHELVHAHNFVYYGYNTKHGPTWKQTMRMVGLRDDVYHDYEMPNTLKYICPCSSVIHLGKIKVSRIKAGTYSYLCKRCRRKIVLGDNYERVRVS